MHKGGPVSGAYNLPVATAFQFEHSIAFSPESAAEVLRGIPAQAGVFALRGEDAGAEPYLTRAADIRRRLHRLLDPPETGENGAAVQSKRLNLRERVRSIEYTVTGSEFASLLTLYCASAAIFGQAEARRRLRLHTPYCVRLTVDHAHPRVYVTNRLSRRSLAHTYGPFASRAAAERYADAALDLFKLRRCYEDLVVHPEHPGCLYGEMKKCMAPCNTTCSAEEYASEAAAVERFLATGGGSMLEEIGAARDRASAEMEFEAAARLHEQYTKVKGVAGMAAELVRPLPELRAVIVQPAPKRVEADALEVAVYAIEGGALAGPEPLSTLGVRAVREQTSVGSSLFAQPLMLQAIPLESSAEAAPADSPEARCERALGALAARVPAAVDGGVPGDYLALLRRWFYRPEKQRVGEILFPNADGSWPVRRILNAAARTVLGEPAAMAETQREAVAGAEAEIKTKTLHAGRPEVERVVPVVGKKRAQRTQN